MQINPFQGLFNVQATRDSLNAARQSRVQNGNEQNDPSGLNPLAQNSRDGRGQNADGQNGNQQGKLRELMSLLDQQQRELDKMVQTYLQQMSAIKPEEGQIAAGRLKAFEAAISNQTNQIANLNNLISQAQVSGSIGGFVGQQAAGGRSFHVMA